MRINSKKHDGMALKTVKINICNDPYSEQKWKTYSMKPKIIEKSRKENVRKTAVPQNQ